MANETPNHDALKIDTKTGEASGVAPAGSSDRAALAAAFGSTSHINLAGSPAANDLTLTFGTDFDDEVPTLLIRPDTQKPVATGQFVSPRPDEFARIKTLVQQHTPPPLPSVRTSQPASPAPAEPFFPPTVAKPRALPTPPALPRARPVETKVVTVPDAILPEKSSHRVPPPLPKRSAPLIVVVPPSGDADTQESQKEGAVTKKPSLTDRWKAFTTEARATLTHWLVPKPVVAITPSASRPSLASSYRMHLATALLGAIGLASGYQIGKSAPETANAPTTVATPTPVKTSPVTVSAPRSTVTTPIIAAPAQHPLSHHHRITLKADGTPATTASVFMGYLLRDYSAANPGFHLARGTATNLVHQFYATAEGHTLKESLGRHVQVGDSFTIATSGNSIVITEMHRHGGRNLLSHPVRLTVPNS